MIIWKYNFKIEDQITISMPEEAKVLSVQVQYGIPTIWILCDPDKGYKERNFRLLGTGQPIKGIDVNSLSFVGTFQTLEGDLVCHLFEESEVQ